MNDAPRATEARPQEPVDPDPEETKEWLDALDAVLEREGPQRAHLLLEADGD